MLKFKNIVLCCFLLVFLIGCVKKEKHLYTNDLIKETSPYLLQHAHNPVNWKAWNPNTLKTAKTENKLMVISIGYAACHWCHVMEKESFEDSIIAKTMNKNFINIKVDREERPDVDKVYIKAVQLMTGNAGWPLNVIALPDGRPIFGGTYFTKQEWLKVLQQVSKKFKENPDSFYAFAEKLEEGIKGLDVIEVNTKKPVFTKDFIKNEVDKWQQSFDTIYGGNNVAPKFMMPNNYQFLMRYAFQNDNNEILKHVKNTLNRMAFGGLYDQINGGFSRYSTDKKWHIPHFEKMLYDNAQMVSLYSKAYQLTKNETYKNVVFETLEFVKKELTSTEDVFYSSLDADSFNLDNVLEEGAYYYWTKNELKLLIKNNFNLFSKYYNINKFGSWGKDKYVLIKSTDDITFSKQNNVLLSDLKKLKVSWKTSLQKHQKERNKPRLDDKILTSWNALMINAYLDAYIVFNKEEYLDSALKAANFILKNQLTEENKLYHNYKNGKSTINGLLEDYATVIDAFIKLHQITSEELWLQKANNIVEYTLIYFYDKSNNLFNYTSKKEASLIAKIVDYEDNVIASSNSIMAKNLFALSHYLSQKKYNNIATLMLNNVKSKIENNGSYFSNWLDLMLNYTNPYFEVVIVGKNAKLKLKELNKTYLPNILISYNHEESNLPLLKNRFIEGETYIYVCVNSSCKMPVKTIKESLEFIKY